MSYSALMQNNLFDFILLFNAMRSGGGLEKLDACALISW